jgi:TonB-dependent starch-binding outer membrane protein SusC
MKKVVLLISMLFFVGVMAVNAQMKTITGKVVSSSDNTPIPGAIVAVKGTTVGTVTNADGNFSLSVPQGTKSLMFSFVGYRTQEISLEGKTVFNVSLEMDVFAVDEVVVVGYGVQQKRDVAGSISTVKGEDIKLAPVQSFDQALQGKASGVMITIPNGVLNNPPVIRVRGFNSITSSSYPLIVVDGVPIFTGDVSSNSAASNALADINPSDIQSMDILKDASATAIYGSRAANGVILITTKKGYSAKAKVSYDGYFGYTQPYHLFEVMNAEQYVEHKNKALANNPTAYSTQFNIPVLNGIPVNTKWSDYIYRTGFQHSHAVSISGATAATSYFLSVGYNNQEGMIRKNTYERKNARLNIDHKLNKFVTLGANFSLTNSLNKAPNTGSLEGQAFNTAGAGRLAFVLPPNLSPYLADGNYNINGAQIGSMGQPVAAYGYYNPVPIFDLCQYSAENDRILANLSATIQPFKGLSFKTVYGMDNLSVETISFQTGLTGDSYASNGSATNYFNRLKRWTWTNTIDYSLTLIDKLNLGILGGAEEQYTSGNNWNGSKTNVADPFFTTYQGSWVTAGMGGGGQYENYFVSYFGRFNANYDKKYYFELSVRRDGFSGLAEGRKFGTFGGASLMWNVSNESFIKDSSIGELFSDIRLKASYGKVGNMSGIGSYASLFLYGSGVYGAVPTWVFSQAGNPDLKWETSDKYDMGLSFGMLKDRIQLNLNYFYNNVNDLILNVPQSPSKGVPGNTIPMNIGSLYNKGFELSFTSYNFTKGDFKWTTNFNLSTLKNEVTALAAGVTELVGTTAGLETTNRTLVGYPIGNLFAVETRGVDPTTGRRVFVNKAGKEVLYSHEAAAANRWTYKDGSGNAPAITLNSDGKVMGSPIPKIYGGFDNTFNYKNVDLSVNLTYALDFDLYNGSKAGLRDQRWWNNSAEVYETAWSKAGDITNIPKPIMNDNVSNGSALPISENIEKGGYVKVKNISLGYTFNKIPFNIGLEKIRIYGQVFNAFVITKYTGSDPEVSANGNSNLTPGIDRNTAPQARTISFGANISF